ncbi:MAG: hypothetical protein WC496_10895 [Phycisphaerae bacterium]|jgi:hypothetical protein
MPAENKQNERRFDDILKKNLKQHRESIRNDFARELLAKIQKAEQQKALAKVIMQERVLLAACIFLPIAAIAVIFAFPNLIVESSQQTTILHSLLIQLAKASMNHWQLCIYYTMAVAAVIYTVYEMVLAEH